MVEVHKDLVEVHKAVAEGRKVVVEGHKVVVVACWDNLELPSRVLIHHQVDYLSYKERSLIV